MPGQMPEVYEGDRPYIFVCYAHADRDAVLPIIRSLVDEGYRVWYDDGIQAATHYPKYIADHVYGCASFVMFVSHRSLNSNWCNDEANYALDLRKNILPVYLEKAELTRDLQMRMGHTQALYWNAYDSDEAFCEELFEASVLDPCLTDEGKQRRGVKPKTEEPKEEGFGVAEAESSKPKMKDGGVEKREACDDDKSGEDEQPVMHEGPVTDVADDGVQSAWTSDEILSSLTRADVGNGPFNIPTIPQNARREGVQERQKGEYGARRAGGKSSSRSGIQRSANGRIRYRRVAASKKSHQILAMRIAVAIAVVMAIAAAALGISHLVSGRWPSTQTNPIAHIDGVGVRAAVGDYSWDELKQLSAAIAEAPEDEWLDIAKAYNLVDTDGRLQGDEKALKLNDGTEASVRILGFRHDELEAGGKAGITFEFADVPVTHQMNAESTNEGGWEQSEMRERLNSDFLSLLPSDLQSCIETAKKQTNNVGRVEFEDDTSVVTITDDKLWLLSMTEVYGSTDGVWSSATYDAEGGQCQLYADKGVTIHSYEFCKKDGADAWWSLRSPNAYNSDSFLYVDDDGDWVASVAYLEWGVSPGFCF